MRQLPLAMQLRASSVFASFLPGANQPVVTLLQDLTQTGPSPVVFLYGPQGVGKTHLLQALCARAGEQGHIATYLPLRELQVYGPELLSGLERNALLCIDDVDSVVQQMEWNRALFNIHRELEEHAGKLVLADEQPPASMPFALRDLASRVLAGTVLRLQHLNEDEQLAAFRLHAAQRGLELPDDTANFVLRRLPRDMGTLCAFLDELDEASLAAQRKLTVPFVREVLERKVAGS